MFDLFAISTRAQITLNRLETRFFSSQKETPRDATPQTPRQRKMILTNCAACAAPLAHNAPRCVRCHTRYCNATCQHDHWRRGHKQICKRIHRGGGAEEYHATKKYKEAVAVAVEACAADMSHEALLQLPIG